MASSCSFLPQVVTSSTSSAFIYYQAAGLTSTLCSECPCPAPRRPYLPSRCFTTTEDDTHGGQVFNRRCAGMTENQALSMPSADALTKFVNQEPRVSTRKPRYDLRTDQPIYPMNSLSSLSDGWHSIWD